MEKKRNNPSGKSTEIEQDLDQKSNDNPSLTEYDLDMLKGITGDENLLVSFDKNGDLCDQNGNCLIPKNHNRDGYGQLYEIKWELREKFPNSYFYCDYYDDSICGVNLLTGSIIYELQELGYLHTIHVEGHFGDLGDRLECGGIVSNRMNQLTTEELDGKVPPTVIFVDKDLEHWCYVRGHAGIFPEDD